MDGGCSEWSVGLVPPIGPTDVLEVVRRCSIVSI